MKKPAARKNRQSDQIEAALARDEIRRHRHLADFEFLKLELAPESFRRVRIGRHDLDAFGLHYAFHQGIDPLIESGNKAQFKSRHILFLLNSCCGSRRRKGTACRALTGSWRAVLHYESS